MSAEPRPSSYIYRGLFVVTLATLMHEILLTRIFSVTMWYHFAFMAISIAMLGMTVGAIVVFLRPSTDAEAVPRRLASWGLAYAISLVVGFLIYLQISSFAESSHEAPSRHVHSSAPPAPPRNEASADFPNRPACD